MCIFYFKFVKIYGVKYVNCEVFMGFFDFFKNFGSSSTPETTVVNQSVLDSVPNNCVMIIEDVFSIPGKGVVVTGTVLRNSINLNDTLMVMESNKTVRVVGIEVFRKQLEFAETGMNVGLLLDGVTRDELMASYKLLKM